MPSDPFMSFMLFMSFQFRLLGKPVELGTRCLGITSESANCLARSALFR